MSGIALIRTSNWELLEAKVEKSLDELEWGQAVSAPWTRTLNSSESDSGVQMYAKIHM